MRGVRAGAPRGVQTYNDPFEGPTRGFLLYLDPSQLTAIGGADSHDGLVLRVMVVAVGDHRAVASAGTTVDLRIGNDTRTATSTADAEPVVNVLNAQVITQWQVAVTLTPEQTRWLSAAPLELVRVTIASTPYVLQLNARDGRQVQENIRTLSTRPSPPR